MGQNVTTETAERRVIVPKSEECEQETLGAKTRGGRGLLKGPLAPQISRLHESDLQGSRPHPQTLQPSSTSRQ